MTLGELRREKYMTTEEETPKEIGTWDYLTNYLDDDLATGAGQFLGNMADMTERATRPENMSPVEWKNN